MLRSLPFSYGGQDSDAWLAWRPGIAARWQLAATLLFGLMLRLGLLSRPGMHPDEALYASWALRIAEGRDPALLGVLVDKPPLFPYLLAGLFRLIGHSATAPANPTSLVAVAGLAAVGASLVSLVLLWAIAHHVHGPQTALAAVALYAISPLAVRLAPSLLTDPWLVLWMLVGLWAGLKGRPWLAGLACGLAYATKQQAVLLIPLIVAVYWLSPRLPAFRQGITRAAPYTRESILRFAGGFMLVFTIVLWWDSLRWQWMPSFWDRGTTAYGGLALTHGRELVERIRQWSELAGYTFGWPLLALLVAAGCIALRLRRVRLAAFDRLLVASGALYMLVHLITNMAAWDRYVLPLVPLLALLLGRGAAALTESLGQSRCADGSAQERLQLTARFRWALAALLAVIFAYTTWLATFSRIPVGDSTAYDGVVQVSEHIRLTQPPGAILYHHWLGWHYGFYLADAPVDMRYWESPADLAAKAAIARGTRQLIAFPAGRDQRGPQQALATAGLRLQPELAVSHPDGSLSITLYRIVPTNTQALNSTGDNGAGTEHSGRPDRDSRRSPSS